jgi:gliding motility-associated-like protein
LAGIGPGTYTLEIKDSINECNAVAGPYTITNLNGPTADIANVHVTAATCSLANGGITGMKVNGTGNITYNWLDASGIVAGVQTDLLHVKAGKYVCVYKDESGCAAAGSDTFEITDKGAISIDSSQMVITPASCNQQNGAVRGVIVAGATGYQWITESDKIVGDALELMNMGAGKYTLLLSNTEGCTLSASVNLTAIPAPVIDDSKISITDDRCNEGTGRIAGLRVKGQAPFVYNWYPAGQEQDLSGIGAGDYYVVVKDRDACPVKSSTYHVNNSNTGLPDPELEDIVIVKGMDAEIQVKGELQGMYQLYAASGVPLYTNISGNFTIEEMTVTTSFYVQQQVGDCSSTMAKVTVKVIDEVKVLTPTAFSPNGDGQNDVLHIKAFGVDVLDYFNVYNRWGTLVFSTKIIQEGWDGTFKGIGQPAGSYIWTISGRDIKGHVIQKQGSVALVR